MSRLDRPIVMALGGNAISPADEEGNIPQQFQTTRQTVVYLADLIEMGGRLLVTHGNGPQVGNVLRRVELAAHEIYTLPLDICVSDTQGGMGYMIAQCLNNELHRRGIGLTANTIITTVEVDRNDPEFEHPTKPVGGFYTSEKAAELQQRYGWKMVASRDNGKYRRVVPSPLPRRIVEVKLIRECVAAGDLVIAGGGGGIPVTRDQNGDYMGVEAVIDKDRTSALLASAIEAGAFVIVTDVNKVALNFGKPDQRAIDRTSVSEAKHHLHNGQFPAGSMGPKIEAAIDYLEHVGNPDACVIISDLDHLMDAMKGREGTWIQPDSRVE
ncbi:MAG: carbamate kinase [Phycisphaerae bacterium]